MKRFLLWFLVHYDNFVEISWRVVHLAFVFMGAIYLFRNFIHEHNSTRTHMMTGTISLCQIRKFQSVLGIFLLNQGTQSITYDQSIYDRTQGSKLDDLVGESFIPSHRCITVRDHVYL